MPKHGSDAQPVIKQHTYYTCTDVHSSLGYKLSIRSNADEKLHHSFCFAESLLSLMHIVYVGLLKKGKQSVIRRDFV